MKVETMGLGTVFSQFVNKNKTSNIPYVNEINPSNVNNADFLSYYNYKKIYMDYYKFKIPELTALINKVATDINEDYYFEPIEKSISGRNKIKQANIMAQNINLSQVNFSHFIDILVTGEGYGWKGIINKNQIKEKIRSSLKNKGLPQTDELINLSFKINFTDEDVLKPRKYRYVASTTIENLYDEYEIIGYKQKIGAKEGKTFSREEIIHYKFYDIDGRISGFSCVGSILTQLELLRFMWQNQTAIAKNGGHMDKIISVQDIDINSPAYKRIESEVKRFNLNYQSRHGVLLLNGKIDVKELAQLDSMQFKEMGLYITGLIAMQWGIPRSSIPYIVGGANTKDDTGGNSEIGYWKNIRSFRRYYCDIFNTQFWIPYFGVMMRFKDTYNHQDLLEQQKIQTKLNNITFMNNELMRLNKQLSFEYVAREFDLSNEDVIDNKHVSIDNSSFRQNLLSNNHLSNNSDGVNISVEKRKSKINSYRNKKNSGFGKEHTFFEMKAKKDLSFKERQTVNINQFIELYNEDKNFNRNPPRVFYAESEDVVHLIYRSTDFVYETFVEKKDISSSLFMNFIKLYRVNEEIIKPTEQKIVQDNIIMD